MMDKDQIQNKVFKTEGESNTRKRALMRDGLRAIAQGWITPDNPAWVKLQNTVLELMDDPDGRTRKGACAIQAKMFDSALKFAEHEDKVDRLDGGQATENVRHVIYEVDRGPKPDH